MGGGTVSGVSKGYRCGVILDDTAAGVDKTLWCSRPYLPPPRLRYMIPAGSPTAVLLSPCFRTKVATPSAKVDFTKCAVDAGIAERHGKVERLGGISVVSGYGLGNGQIAVLRLPATVKNCIVFQNRTVHIRHCTCGIRVQPSKAYPGGNSAVLSVYMLCRYGYKSFVQVLHRWGYPC